MSNYGSLDTSRDIIRNFSPVASEDPVCDYICDIVTHGAIYVIIVTITARLCAISYPRRDCVLLVTHGATNK